MKKTYKDAGVDRDTASSIINTIKDMAKVTFRPEVVLGIGGFSGLFSLNLNKYKAPILAASSDGVGTKTKIAFMMNKHDTIGIDLVAMVVNDLITCGAEPLFIMDYIAVGKLVKSEVEAIIKGIVEGCKRAGCSLLGGETAEMPSLYKEGEYDLAGFGVGIVENEKMIDNSGITGGDKIIGIASSGIHSNGYSLVRKILFEDLNLDLNSRVITPEKTLGEILLEPTKIYSHTILNILRDFTVKGIAHITGGGFIENIPRILSKGCEAVIDKNSWEVPAIFLYLKEEGKLDEKEMFRTFNNGIGMVLVVSPKDEDEILLRLKGLNEKAYVIGEIEIKKEPTENQEGVRLV